PARGIHDVVVELLGKTVPQPDRVVVDRRGFVVEVVGANDRGVAAGVAAAEPALLDHRDIGDAMLAREIVGRRQPVPARADDDHFVFGPGLWRTPLRLPALVTAQGFARYREG